MSLKYEGQDGLIGDKNVYARDLGLWLGIFFCVPSSLSCTHTLTHSIWQLWSIMVQCVIFKSECLNFDGGLINQIIHYYTTVGDG